MAKHQAQDYYVKINSVDLSNWAFNVDLKLEREKLDVSGFNSTGAKEWVPGSKDEEATVSFRGDFAANAVDATLAPLYFNSTTFPILMRPTSGTISATNPEYRGSANLYEYHPLNAEVGEVAETQVTFAFTGAVTRGTA